MGIEELIKEKLLKDAEEKGIEKGIEKTTFKVISQLLNKGLEPQAIVDLLEIDISQVLNVKEALRKKSDN